jgi:4'-phosphopantetheinyl transferase
VTAIDWIAPPPRLSLSGAAVHVWRAALNLREAQLAALETFLNAEEEARAARLRFDEKRRAFVAARGALRDILGRYLGLSPKEVRFSYTPQGKPELAPTQAKGLQFNLAHSGQLALVALTYARPVGVDVEQLHPLDDMDRLVERYFAPGEQTVFGRLRLEQKLPAFFAGWTRKEAYLKAHGAGLTWPLDQFEVTLAPGEPPAVTLDRLSPPGAPVWTLVEIEAGPGYAAALAVPGPIDGLTLWQWLPTG